MTDERAEAVNLGEGRYVSRVGLERMLVDWAPPPDQPASTLYLRPGQVDGFLTTSHLESHGWRELLSRMDPSVLNSDTGIAGLRAGAQALVIIPPFPFSQDKITASWDPSPLLSLLETEYTVGVVLLRLGRFSVAVYQGERLASSKTDARYVKGRHHAGGTSQKRFQRIREGQIRRIYDKTCLAVLAQFSPYSQQLHYIFLGGDRFTLNGFLKVCPYLEQFRGIILDRRLNIRDPKHDTLAGVGEMLRQSRVYQVQW